MGRPKSATFRTCDVVGLDTLVHVVNGVASNCTDDERHSSFAVPSYVQHLVDNKWLGSNCQGFYKKTKDENGIRKILVFDLETRIQRQEKDCTLLLMQQSK